MLPKKILIHGKNKKLIERIKMKNFERSRKKTT